MTYLFTAIKIAIICAAGYAMHAALVYLIEKGRSSDYLTNQMHYITRASARWFIIVVTALLILQQLGIEASYILAAISTVLVLVAVGFVAVWSVLSNILCAFLLLLFPPFRIGDVIELKDPEKDKGLKGKVTDLNMFYTSLEAVEDGEVRAVATIIRVPNTLFFQRAILCYAGTETEDLQIRPGHNRDKPQQDDKNG